MTERRPNSTRRGTRRPRSRTIGALLLLVVGLGVAACGSARDGRQVEATTVRVDNQGFLDANIFVVRGTQRIRLGNVPGLTTRVLRIPDSVIFGGTPLRFIAEPIGAPGSPITQEIVVYEGDEVRLRLRGW